jgi:kinesin family protein 6/9
VIVALQERSQGKARPHVPYRNSMMTSVLRDSLGGNCRTVMIATVNTAPEQLEETISTCRFAQRVAQISNQVYVNEELDPVLVIRRLKQEIRDLKVGRWAGFRVWGGVQGRVWVWVATELEGSKP